MNQSRIGSSRPRRHLPGLSSRTVRYSLITALIFLNLFFSYKIVCVLFSPRANEKSSAHGKGLQIEVVNASGSKTGAVKLVDRLRANQVDVIRVSGFGGGNVYTSLMIDRTGDRGKAGALALLLGMDSSKVLTEIDTTLLLDATLLLGKDFEKINIKD